MPAALLEAYGLFGRRTDLTRNQDVMLGPDRIHVDESGEVLVLRLENQGCARWGVRVADLGQPDPPVVWEDTSTTSKGWSPFLDRLSTAFVEVVLSESLFGKEGFSDNRELDPGQSRPWS